MAKAKTSDQTTVERKAEAAAAKDRDKSSQKAAAEATKRADDRREALARERKDPSRKAEHTHGGTTTRDDATDVGVPMLPGSPNEPQGPEDALGEGPKRGDYRERIGPSDYNPTETVPVADAEPGEPTTKLVNQRPRAEQIGDAKGKKGGVDTREEK
jgi:hypothetical protein